MKNETVTVQEARMGVLGKVKGKTKLAIAKLICFVETLMFMISNSTMAYAKGFGAEQAVSIKTSVASANKLMGQLIGILLMITRYVGVGILVYGVYEVVLSFTSDQPEKRVKGISLALAGVVLVALRSVIAGFGVIGNGVVGN